MAKMSREVIDLFNDAAASKALATVDAVGYPNVAPKGTLAAIDEETIAFADIFGGKTRANLQASNRVAAVAFRTQGAVAGYQVKGTFQGFQSSGPLFDRFAQQIKQALKIDIKQIGTIKVDEVYSVGPSEAGKKLA